MQSSKETGIGQPVRRREDFRLLTGKGCYSDDFSFPGQAYAVMVRHRVRTRAFVRSIRRGGNGARGSCGSDWSRSTR